MNAPCVISWRTYCSYGGCGSACSCFNQQSCTSGDAKRTCCWSGNKCTKINFLTDRANCGKCSNKCRGYDTCCIGKCVGDLQFDPNNCGKCNNKCRGYTSTCCRGVCKSPASFATDPANCGQCGNRCFSNEKCCGTCTM
jgi:hypothetical protein